MSKTGVHNEAEGEGLRDSSSPATWELLSNQWINVKAKLNITWWGRAGRTEVHAALEDAGPGNLVFSEYFYDKIKHKGRFCRLISVTFNDGDIQEISVQIEKCGAKSYFGCSGLKEKDQAQISLTRNKCLSSVLVALENMHGGPYTPLKRTGCEQEEFISKLVMDKRVLMACLEQGAEWWGDNLDPDNIKHGKCNGPQTVNDIFSSLSGSIIEKPSLAYTYRERINDPCYLFEVSTPDNIYTVSLEKKAFTVSKYSPLGCKQVCRRRNIEDIMDFFREEMKCFFLKNNYLPNIQG